MSLGPNCACISCLVMILSPWRIRSEAGDVVQPMTLQRGSSSSADPNGRAKQARTFGGQRLVTAEETRSSASRQHAQVAARADATRAQPRPAFTSRQGRVSAEELPCHGKPRWLEDSTAGNRRAGRLQVRRAVRRIFNYGAVLRSKALGGTRAGKESPSRTMAPLSKVRRLDSSAAMVIQQTAAFLRSPQAISTV